MDLGLKGKTAIVTGASQGIGKEIAQALHGEGVALVIVGQTDETLHQAARAITAATNPRGADQRAPVHPIVADLSVRAEVERVVRQAIERLGQVDILVNNAARAKTGSFFDMTEGDLQEVWQVKAFGYVRMVRALGPHMMERRSGCIINVVGNTARTPSEDFIIGSMVNAALVNFTRGIARELARHNVRIHAISPGWTLTERLHRSFELQAATQNVSVEEIERREARAIPLKRLVSLDEVAALALLLASDKLPAMTGEEIIIDGGATPAI
jgi:3-oxoacyl-[acyl-carrier protein] reductase/bacilysin biosynthesis oxidoreductase BacG